MFGSVIVYTKPDCPWCERAKAFLEGLDIEYQTFEVGKDLTADELKAKAEPGVIQTVPQVFINGNRIGGYEDLVKREADLKRFAGWELE